MKSSLIINHRPRRFLRSMVYKLYVIALLVFVVWAAQFIYPLIYWEFQFLGTDKKIIIDKNDPEIIKIKKLRNYLNNEIQVKTLDLGDIVLSQHYEQGHFHHVGHTLTAPVYNGCDYCHTVAPHKKGEKARAFRNLHGYTLTCETCHYLEKMKSKRHNHIWIDVVNRRPVKRPSAIIEQESTIKVGKAGTGINYNARIAPNVILDEEMNLVIGRPSEDNARQMLENLDKLKNNQIKGRLLRMHKGLTKKPLECKDCHTKNNPAISYERIGYTRQNATRLMDSEIASLISQYNKFHFPNLFIRKDDRTQSKIR